MAGLEDKLNRDYAYSGGIKTILKNNHFIDRINDPRNKEEITIHQLSITFSKLFSLYYSVLLRRSINENKPVEGVIQNILDKLNIPFAIQLNPDYIKNTYDAEWLLKPKTFLKKDTKTFKSSNPLYPVNF